MSHATRKRTTRGRIQPYAWLGASAVTLGMGAAMVGGTAVAFADTGSDSSGSASSSGSESASSSSTKSDAPRRGVRSAPRGGERASTSASTAAGSSSASAATADAAIDTTDIDISDIDLSGIDNEVASTATRAGKASNPTTDTTPEAVTPVVTPAETAIPAEVPSAPQAAAATTPAAAASAVAAADAVEVEVEDVADPAPSMDSWLPETPIIPGAHVQLAMQQIKDAQASLQAETWGAGNIIAGFGSLGPQSALATAELMLGIWASTIAGAQAAVASSVGRPLMHGIAQARLQNELTYTKLAGLSLQTAYALMTPLSWFGADIAPTQQLVASARENGKVYAKVRVRMMLDTQPVVDVNINGGRKTTLLLDTGASGLVTTPDKVPTEGLGTKIGGGNSCFSGGICYHYDTYNTTVDLGDGAYGVAPVNIVTNNEEYPNSVADFKAFFSWGVDGILGVGANTAGPGPAPIPTASMPGELSNGVLIYQNAYPLGLGGYMILGPNLFPTKVSLAGAPDSYVKVSVNGSALQDAGAIIDTGGVYGTLNRSLYPGAPAGTYVPAGTKIDVYAPDGTTLLYSYTTHSQGTPFIDSGMFNTGNAPYAQNPIYLNYAATPYGIGSTDFSIY